MGRIEILSDNDVEISAGPSADYLAGRGAGQAHSENLGGASRPLRADRTHRGWQAGLFHEMREPAGAAFAPAAGGTQGGTRAGRRARARGAAERPVRLVLRPQVTGRASCAKPPGMLFA